MLLDVLRKLSDLIAYPPVRNPETMQMSRREYLGIYIYAHPKNEMEREFNTVSSSALSSKLNMLVKVIGSKNTALSKESTIGIIYET